MNTNVGVIRGLVDREHGLLNERTNIFLLLQSILMAGFALGDPAPHDFRLIITLMGLISSALWLYIGILSRDVLHYYRKKLLECESGLPGDEMIYTESIEFRDKKQRRIFRPSIGRCLAFIFPSLWVLTWIFILVEGLTAK